MMADHSIKKTVHVADQHDYDPAGISEKAAAMLTADGLDVSGRSVFLLYCSDWSWYRAGAGTNPLFVIGVAEALAKLGAGPIWVGDPAGYGMPESHSDFTKAYRERLKNSARFVPLPDTRRATVSIGAPLVHHEFRVPALCMNSDFFIALPKAKTNLFTDASTSAVTMLELLTDEERYQYHDYRMHLKLADVYGIRRPDYVIYDAVVCGEGQGPIYGSPHSLKLMVGGANAVNVDTVMCRLMGLAPERIDHLRMLADRRAGSVAWKTIAVEPPEAVVKAEKFRKAEWDIERAAESVRVVGGKEFYCASGCVGFARQAIEPWLADGGARLREPVHFVIGRQIEQFSGSVDRSRTLVVGDCAECHAGLGRFVPGCPPRPEDVEIALLEILRARGSRSLRLRLARRLGAPRKWALEYMRSRAFDELDRFTVSISAVLRHSAGRIMKRASSRVLRLLRIGKRR